MKSYTLYLAFLILMLPLMRCSIPKKTTKNNYTSIEKQPLVAYGQRIYQNEKCSRCHTQNISQSGKRQISLDGVGGKYSNSWLYLYFQNPEVLIFDSKKKPYKHLYVETLQKSMLFGKQGGYTDKEEKIWEKLVREAKEVSGIIQESLEADEKVSHHLEILALIAYIQQIPTSQNKAVQDSIERVKQFEEYAAWQGVQLDSNSIIFEVASDENNIEEGRKIFRTNCTPCHGGDGGGGIGPNLTDEYWLHGSRKMDIARSIAYGVPSKGMIRWQTILSPKQVGALVAYISSLQGTKPQNPKAPQGEKAKND